MTPEKTIIKQISCTTSNIYSSSVDLLFYNQNNNLQFTMVLTFAVKSNKQITLPIQCILSNQNCVVSIKKLITSFYRCMIKAPPSHHQSTSLLHLLLIVLLLLSSRWNLFSRPLIPQIVIESETDVPRLSSRRLPPSHLRPGRPVALTTLKSSPSSTSHPSPHVRPFPLASYKKRRLISA